MKKIIVALTLLLSLLLTSCSSVNLYIGENGNWWNGDEDLGVAAQGPQGEQGPQGTPGEKGDTGEAGESVTVVSVSKTNTEGSVDTYTIYFSDNSSTTFTVTNGSDGKSITITSVDKINANGLTDTYKITFSDGTHHTFTVKNGEDGKSITVTSIGKTNSVGLIDTYEIVFSDGTKSTFTVTNGRDGNTPYIGANGNWWVGDEDTGVLADYSADDRKISDGLVFVTATVGGKAGMIVVEYEGSDKDVVIPNYVGSVPVIGIGEDAFTNTSITSVSLSKNTIWLGQEAFYNCNKLTSVDFNGAKLTEIPYSAFYGTAITSITLPESVTKLGDRAFYNSSLAEINYENITYFGSYSLNTLCLPYVYLTKDVEYVGSYTFSDTFVFLEHETLPTTWGSSIAGSDTMFRPIVNTTKSGDYIYALNDGQATVHRYIGESKRVQIPSTIDGHKVVKIGAGFDSYSENIFEDDELYISEYQKIKLDEVVIPNTVTEIERYAFLLSSSLIYVPKSVEAIAFSNEDYHIFSFYAFEDAYFGSEVNDDLRYANGINYNKIVYDEEHKVFLYEDLLGYSVLASLQFYTPDEIVVPGTYNGKTVHTIMSWAYHTSEEVSIRISSGVNKIQKYAFAGEAYSFFIPKSVKTIIAYGVCYADCYLVEAIAKPDEWDTYWNGNRSGITYGVSGDTFIDATNKMMYKVENGKVTLTKYLGSNSTIYIPRTINGYTVTKIATGFYSSSSTRYIYIPKEVTNIESKAFTNTSYSTHYFYFEIAEQPLSWGTEWYYNSYYGNYTRNISKSWNREFSY